MEFRDEKEIAKMAERMLGTAMRRKVTSLGFKEHISGNKSLASHTIGKASTKVGTGPGNASKIYMNKLALVMPRHGFIQHYGSKSIRTGGQRTRHRPETRTYNFASHYYNLPEKDYIGKAVRESGVIDFVMSEITRIRCREVWVGLQTFLDGETR